MDRLRSSPQVVGRIMVLERGRQLQGLQHWAFGTQLQFEIIFRVALFVFGLLRCNAFSRTSSGTTRRDAVQRHLVFIARRAFYNSHLSLVLSTVVWYTGVSRWASFVGTRPGGLLSQRHLVHYNVQCGGEGHLQGLWVAWWHRHPHHAGGRGQGTSAASV